jgi:tannase/feruloyl esterase
MEERMKRLPRSNYSVGLGVTILCLLAGVPAQAAMPNCTMAAVTSLGVTNMTVISVTDVPGPPEFCRVLGFVTTTGFNAPNGSAGFEVRLPATWNGKFVFWGVGGLAGNTSPAVTPTDFFGAAAKGYATAITDTGHQAGGTDASWAITSPGVPDSAKVVDYYFRAAHQVTVAAKQLVQAFFQGPIQRAYFDGCSNGGRMAFVQATRFPDDYDGVIAGAPFMDIRTVVAGLKQQKVQLQSAETYIPAAKLPMIDTAVYASCDLADGVADHLIQNPAVCAFDPASLVTASCTVNDPTCLTAEQATTLRSYFSALRNERADVIYPGESVSDLGGAGGAALWTTGFVPPIDFTAKEPWGGAGFNPAPLSWQFVDHITQFLVERDPSFNARSFDVSVDGVVSGPALNLWDQRTEAGDGDVPESFEPFIQLGKKLLIYHGLSDPALPAFRTIKFYRDLEQASRGGYKELQDNVRLFMVPGMQHCGGGPGPNTFDTLTALENWVEHGVAPDAIIAAHVTSTGTVDRTMPLCKFPGQARYSGGGDANDAANWSCPVNDRGMLDIGPNGAEAGLSHGNALGHDDHHELAVHDFE